jgi:hypothetical protein
MHRVLFAANPLQIFGADGLVGWWRADTAIAEAGKCSALPDLSGNNRPLAQPVPAKRPVLGTDSKGHVALLSDGSQEIGLSRTGDLGLNLGDFPCMFFVGRRFSSDFFNVPMMIAKSGTQKTSILYVSTFNPDVSVHAFSPMPPWDLFSSGYDVAAQLEQLSFGVGVKPSFWCLEHAGTVVVLSLDGGAPSTAPIAGGLTEVPDTVQLVGDTDGFFNAESWNGATFEAFITKQAPSPEQFRAVAQYLIPQYGG